MRRILSVVLGAVLLAACSDDEPAGTDEVRIVGNYALESINGQALPVPIFLIAGAYLMEQTAGDIAINGDGTSLERAVIRTYVNDAERGVVFEEDTSRLFGVWEAEDSVIIITSQNDFSFGFVSGDRLTLSFEIGDSLYTQLYRRRN